jgi:shikimate dehydrogenase
MIDRYAVIGNPVAHSKSPQIHTLFAYENGQDMEYGRLLAPLDGFRHTVERFRAEGGKGLNVTLPFKEEAYRLATSHSERARTAEAVNTLRFDASGIYGDNTDGAGLVRDIRDNLGFAIAGRRVLMLGAGGAARGVIGPLLAEHPKDLTIANRTVERARALERHFGPQSASQPAPTVRASTYEALSGSQFDIVVNATSASLAGALPPLPRGVYAAGALAYDMMYGRGLTPFLEHARAEGAGRTADGLGMLIEQAAESFFVWRGLRPRTAGVLASLRAE